jgi:uncharacterized membrane protein YidH (DUF202 family)
MTDRDGGGDAGAGSGGPADRSAQPFDRGLQPERTALAWRRTSLALTVGALVGVRIVPTLFGAWLLVPTGAIALVAMAVLVLSHRRYLSQHRALTTAETDRIPLDDGALPALVAGVALLLGLGALAAVFLL